MLCKKAITRLRLPALLAFIVMNFASTDIMAASWHWTGSAHGCWVFHLSTTGVIFPGQEKGSVVGGVRVDCGVSNKGREVSSLTIESQLRRSLAPSNGYVNYYWKKNTSIVKNGRRSAYQHLNAKCRKSRGYYYAPISRISAKLNSGKRLGYTKWINQNPHSRTRAFVKCG